MGTSLHRLAEVTSPMARAWCPAAKSPVAVASAPTLSNASTTARHRILSPRRTAGPRPAPTSFFRAASPTQDEISTWASPPGAAAPATTTLALFGDRCRWRCCRLRLRIVDPLRIEGDIGRAPLRLLHALYDDLEAPPTAAIRTRAVLLARWFLLNCETNCRSETGATTQARSSDACAICGNCEYTTAWQTRTNIKSFLFFSFRLEPLVSKCQPEKPAFNLNLVSGLAARTNLFPAMTQVLQDNFQDLDRSFLILYTAYSVNQGCRVTSHVIGDK